MIDLSAYKAVLFDLDGVITPTADIHRHAWEKMFSDFLATQYPDVAPYAEQDYFDYLDGRRREEGVAALLESRGINADATLIDTLGTRKNDDFLQLVAQGVKPYSGSVAFLDSLALDDDLALAIVSSSKNAIPVLESAGLKDRFGLIVDGNVAHDKGLPGKPAPDTYVYAAEYLSADPSVVVVVEDATSGVASGRAGGFGLIIGVDRGTGRQALLDAGADIVVDDLAELVK